jgi:hypothetical protein
MAQPSPTSSQPSKRCTCPGIRFRLAEIPILLAANVIEMSRSNFSVQLDLVLRLIAVAICAMALSIGSLRVSGEAPKKGMRTLTLDSTEEVEVIGGTPEVTVHNGRRALRLIALPEAQRTDDAILALVRDEDFRNGTLEIEVAGAPRPGAPADDRGFIGMAFRCQQHGSRREVMYLRPTNGRADDQLRRNHSTQYESIPDFPWYRLRKDSPGVYESYVDLKAGEWTKMRIVVSGTKAFLFVNDGSQPCLIVNDLKLGETHGQIALWAYWSTEAYFSNLKIDSE